MSISKNHSLALRVQFFLIALLSSIILGLYLLCRGGRSATLYCVLLPVCLFFTPKSWLRDIKAVWLQWWDMDRQSTRRLLLTVLAATLVFSLAAHLFAFTNEIFNHDSLCFISYNKNFTKWLAVGRPFITLFDVLTGSVSLPWLLGLLFMFWMFLAAVLAIRILHIHNTAGRVLLCGLLCANTSLTNLIANYTFCVSDYALALLLVLAAVWLFCRCRCGEILGVYLIVVSMLIYQSYFTASIAFCFFSVVRMLVHNETARSVVLRGVRYLALLAAGFAAYYLAWTALCVVFGMEKARLGSLTLSYGPGFVWKMFLESFSRFFRVHLNSGDFFGRLAPAIKLLVMVLILAWLLCWLMDKRLAKANKVLLALSVCALPVVLDFAYVLFTQGNLTHVEFNMGLLGVFLLLCLSCPAPAVPTPRRYRAAALLLAAALLWQNIIFSNSLYIKMELNKEATVSLFTRVIERVEEMEGYVPGSTPVAFSNSIFNNSFLSHGRKGYEWFNKYNAGAGIYDYSSSWATTHYILDYLNYPMNIVNPPAPEEIADMPAFPYDGSIAWVGDTVVVKLA